MSKPIEIPDEIQMLLDAYRNEGDLARPEMSRLKSWLGQSHLHRQALAATQSRDSQIKKSLLEVTTPPNLRRQILQALSTSTVSLNDPLGDQLHADEPLAERLLRPLQKPRARSTSRWRMNRAVPWVLASLSVCVAVAFFAYNSNRPPQPENRFLSARDLCETSLQWIRLVDNGRWPTPSEASNEDLLIVTKGKKQIRTENGLVDCYLTHGPGGVRVFRFEFPATASIRIPSEFSPDPDLPAHRFACSARRIGNRVVVIAVEGDTSKYQEVLKTGFSRRTTRSMFDLLAAA